MTVICVFGKQREKWCNWPVCRVNRACIYSSCISSFSFCLKIISKRTWQLPNKTSDMLSLMVICKRSNVCLLCDRSCTNLQKCSSKPSHLSLHFKQAAPAPNSWPRVIWKQSTGGRSQLCSECTADPGWPRCFLLIISDAAFFLTKLQTCLKIPNWFEKMSSRFSGRCQQSARRCCWRLGFNKGCKLGAHRLLAFVLLCSPYIRATSCLSPGTHNANVHLNHRRCCCCCCSWPYMVSYSMLLKGSWGPSREPLLSEMFLTQDTLRNARWRRPAELWCWYYYNNNWWDCPPLGTIQKQKEWGLVTRSDIRAQMMHQLIKRSSSTDEQILKSSCKSETVQTPERYCIMTRPAGWFILGTKRLDRHRL